MPLLTIRPYDLTNAGFDVIDGPWGAFCFLRAVDGSGTVSLGALIQVRAEVDGEDAPMSVGQRMLGRRARRWRVSWAAQAGIRATLAFYDPEQIDFDADPPAQLVVGAGAATIVGTSVTVGVAEVQLVAANSGRKGISIRNNGSVAVYIGATGLVVGDGFPLDPGDVWAESDFLGAIFAISGSAAQDVRVLETS
jgi:hypothetical protein